MAPPQTQPLSLNERAWRVADHLASQEASLRIGVSRVGGARILDLGIQSPGGLAAGLALARVCLAGLADVTLAPLTPSGCPVVQVVSDLPVLACMASQYAGWQIAVGKFFAMGSGPMRAAYGGEELFGHIPGRERPPVAVGVLETRKMPTEEVIGFLCEKLGLPPEKLTLLAAPASSMAGTLQVVARSLETALHKLHELHFDLGRVLSGMGTAPMPPVAADEIEAIGRTNDAILYGGHVALWVDGDDEQLAEVGPKVPSSASRDYGKPFAETLRHYEMDFYKVDPLLFSPAVISFHNVRSGRSHTFGSPAPDVLRASFGGAAGG